MKVARSIRSKIALVTLGLLVITIGITTPSRTDVAHANGAAIQATLTDQARRHIVLRTGSYNVFTGQGFGWTKITQRHNIRNLRVIRFAIKSDPGYWDNATRTVRVYRAYAIRYWCPWGTNCRAVERIRYRVVVDFKRPHTYYGVRLNRATIGVLTAYCEMPNGVCDALTGSTWRSVQLRSIPARH